MSLSSSSTSSRRTFLKQSVLAGAAISTGLSLHRSVHAQGTGTIKIGIVGCGGRGWGAAVQALQTGKDVKLVAVGDYFLSRAVGGLGAITQQFPEQVDVPEKNRFGSFGNCDGVVASDADVVLIAGAAKFHPLYTLKAVEAGKHVFVEKPNAIDAQGIHTLEKAVKIAQEKKLCLLSGLQSRYSPAHQELVKRIHDGAIGEVRAIQSFFLRSPYGVRGGYQGITELDFQFYNQYMFRWLSGDDFTQSLVHNVDRMTWVLGGRLPTSALGIGSGRSTSIGRQYGDVFDHHTAFFCYPGDHCRLFAACRTISGCYEEYDDLILGSKGTAYWNAARITGETNWTYRGPQGGGHAEEQVALFAALRKGERLNSDSYIINSTLMAILGQVASYTGKQISWKELYDSKFSFGPAPEECVAGMEPPSQADDDGSFPVPIPGKNTWW